MEKKHLYFIMENDSIDNALVKIACLHLRLAVEHISKGTTPQRRTEIKLQIQNLRIEREIILGFNSVKV